MGTHQTATWHRRVVRTDDEPCHRPGDDFSANLRQPFLPREGLEGSGLPLGADGYVTKRTECRSRIF